MPLHLQCLSAQTQSLPLRNSTDNETHAVIIFSKTTCPFSRKAKSILLDVYNIVPSPHVVEIDQHPLGPRIQSLLADMTGRRTVPNILINGKSIGGGDDIEKLHLDNGLTMKIRSMGGKRIVEANKRVER